MPINVCFSPIRGAPRAVRQLSKAACLQASVLQAAHLGPQKHALPLKITTVLARMISTLGFGKTARAHKRQWQALIEQGLHAISVPVAACLHFPFIIPGQLTSRRALADAYVPPHQFAFHSARHCFTLAGTAKARAPKPWPK